MRKGLGNETEGKIGMEGGGIVLTGMGLRVVVLCGVTDGNGDG